MTTFVHNWDAIKSNLLTLEKYRVSPDASFSDYYRGLISRGTCFVVYRSKNKILFGPSRFLGYVKNSRRAHNSNLSKDGRQTNPQLESILRERFVSNSSLEGLFQRFCQEHDIVPANKNRKFIHVGTTNLSDADLILADLHDISANRKLKGAEKERLVLARIGQGDFRAQLIRMWRCCPVTRCANSSLLRASHIKPWRACTDLEKLDPYNGLLLTPNIDCAFDDGLITFDEKGNLARSKTFKLADAKKVGILGRIKIPVDAKHHKYLEYHRKHIFQK